MRILVHDYAGHPFQIQLSRELARRGHRVLHIYYKSNNTPKGQLQALPEDPSTLRITGLVTRQPIQKYSFVKRWLQEVEYGYLLRKAVVDFAPDVVLSANTPLDALRPTMSLVRKKGIRFVYWLQDLLGLAMREILSRKFGLLGNWIGRYYERLETTFLQNSNQIVVISDAFWDELRARAIPAARVHVIPNWAPLEELPLRDKVNPFSRTHQLAQTFNFVYTGSLGLKHNPELLLQLCLAFRNVPEVRVVVVSEGIGAQWLKEQKKEHQLDNLLLMGYQPYHLLPDVMGSADVLVAILEPEAGRFSVPSKVLSYHCAGRPILLSVPLDNLSARIVSEHETGIVVPPGDVEGFCSAARLLFEDVMLRTRLGRNARKYAERFFNIQQIGDQFEEVLQKG